MPFQGSLAVGRLLCGSDKQADILVRPSHVRFSPNYPPLLRAVSKVLFFVVRSH